MNAPITAADGHAYRDPAGVWRHSDTHEPIPGARDMTLSWLYPDLVIVGNKTVLVPDQLVRESEDLAWVRSLTDGPTRSYDREHARGAPPTPGWSDVWPVPAAVWDARSREPLGIVIDGWTDGPLPR